MGVQVHFPFVCSINFPLRLQLFLNIDQGMGEADLALQSSLDRCEQSEPINKTNDLKLNLTPENVTQHSRIVTTTLKGSSTPTKMSKIIGRQIH